MKFEKADAEALDDFYFDAMNRFTEDPSPEGLSALSQKDKIGLMILGMSFLRIVAHNGVELRAQLAFDCMLEMVSQLGTLAEIPPPSHLPKDSSLTEYLLAQLQ